MKMRNLAILVGVLALGAGAIYIAERRDSTPAPSDPRVGEPLASTENVKDVAVIRLFENGQQRAELLQNADGKWIVPGRNNLPANFQTLSRLINRLTEVEVERFVTRKPMRLQRLDPKASGIAFYDSAGAEEPVLFLHFGKRSDRGGVYVQFDDDPAAYLASEAIFLNTSLDSWVDKNLLPIEPGDVRKARIQMADGAPVDGVAFTRNTEASSFSLPEDLSADGDLQESALQDWLRTLANLRFTRHVPLDSEQVAEALPFSRTHTLETADGWTWSVTLARRPERTVPPEQSNETHTGALPESESDTPSEPESIPAGPAYAIVKATAPDGHSVPDYFSELAFEIPSYSYTQQPAFGDLIEE